jgi:hypothetical protein
MIGVVHLHATDDHAHEEGEVGDQEAVFLDPSPASSPPAPGTAQGLYGEYRG